MSHFKWCSYDQEFNFLGLRLGLFSLILSTIFDSSLCASSIIFGTLFEAIVTAVSSVYILACEKCKHFSKSFKCIMKSRGLNKLLEECHIRHRRRFYTI